MQAIPKKVVTLFVAIVFIIDSTFGWAGDSLSPQTRMSRPEFQKAFQAGYAKLAHRAVNEYIEKYLSSEVCGKEISFITPEDLAAFRTSAKKDIRDILPQNKWWITRVRVKLDDGWHENAELMVVSVPGLLKNTGQIGHVGLGRMNDMPVAYMDSKYFFNQAEIEKALSENTFHPGDNRLGILHEIDEISQYEGKRRYLQEIWRLDISYERMRELVNEDPAMAERFHERAIGVEGLYQAIRRDEMTLDWDALYQAYCKFGFAFETPYDINISASDVDQKRLEGLDIPREVPAEATDEAFMTWQDVIYRGIIYAGHMRAPVSPEWKMVYLGEGFEGFMQAVDEFRQNGQTDPRAFALEVIRLVKNTVRRTVGREERHKKRERNLDYEDDSVDQVLSSMNGGTEEEETVEEPTREVADREVADIAEALSGDEFNKIFTRDEISVIAQLYPVLFGSGQEKLNCKEIAERTGWQYLRIRRIKRVFDVCLDQVGGQIHEGVPVREIKWPSELSVIMMKKGRELRYALDNVARANKAVELTNALWHDEFRRIFPDNEAEVLISLYPVLFGFSADERMSALAVSRETGATYKQIALIKRAFRIWLIPVATQIAMGVPIEGIKWPDNRFFRKRGRMRHLRQTLSAIYGSERMDLINAALKHEEFDRVFTKSEAEILSLIHPRLFGKPASEKIGYQRAAKRIGIPATKIIHLNRVFMTWIAQVAEQINSQTALSDIKWPDAPMFKERARKRFMKRSFASEILKQDEFQKVFTDKEIPILKAIYPDVFGETTKTRLTQREAAAAFGVPGTHVMALTQIFRRWIRPVLKQRRDGIELEKCVWPSDHLFECRKRINEVHRALIRTAKDGIMAELSVAAWWLSDGQLRLRRIFPDLNGGSHSQKSLSLGMPVPNRIEPGSGTLTIRTLDRAEISQIGFDAGTKVKPKRYLAAVFSGIRFKDVAGEYGFTLVTPVPEEGEGPQPWSYIPPVAFEAGRVFDAILSLLDGEETMMPGAGVTWLTTEGCLSLPFLHSILHSTKKQAQRVGLPRGKMLDLSSGGLWIKRLSMEETRGLNLPSPASEESYLLRFVGMSTSKGRTCSSSYIWIGKTGKRKITKIRWRVLPDLLPKQLAHSLRTLPPGRRAVYDQDVSSLFSGNKLAEGCPLPGGARTTAALDVGLPSFLKIDPGSGRLVVQRLADGTYTLRIDSLRERGGHNDGPVYRVTLIYQEGSWVPWSGVAFKKYSPSAMEQMMHKMIARSRLNCTNLRLSDDLTLAAQLRVDTKKEVADIQRQLELIEILLDSGMDDKLSLMNLEALAAELRSLSADIKMAIWPRMQDRSNRAWAYAHREDPGNLLTDRELLVNRVDELTDRIEAYDRNIKNGGGYPAIRQTYDAADYGFGTWSEEREQGWQVWLTQVFKSLIGECEAIYLTEERSRPGFNSEYYRKARAHRIQDAYRSFYRFGRQSRYTWKAFDNVQAQEKLRALTERYELLQYTYRAMIKWAIQGRAADAGVDISEGLTLYRGIKADSDRMWNTIASHSKTSSLLYSGENGKRRLRVYRKLPIEAVQGYWRLYPLGMKMSRDWHECYIYSPAGNGCEVEEIGEEDISPLAEDPVFGSGLESPVTSAQNIGGLDDGTVDRRIRTLIKNTGGETNIYGMVTEIVYEKGQFREYRVIYDEEDPLNELKARRPLRRGFTDENGVVAAYLRSAGVPLDGVRIGIIPSNEAAIISGDSIETSAIVHAGGRIWLPRDLAEYLFSHPTEEGDLLTQIFRHEYEHQQNPGEDTHAKDPEGYQDLVDRLNDVRRRLLEESGIEELSIADSSYSREYVNELFDRINGQKALKAVGERFRSDAVQHLAAAMKEQGIDMPEGFVRERLGKYRVYRALTTRPDISRGERLGGWIRAIIHPKTRSIVVFQIKDEPLKTAPLCAAILSAILHTPHFVNQEVEELLTYEQPGLKLVTEDATERPIEPKRKALTEEAKRIIIKGFMTRHVRAQLRSEGLKVFSGDDSGQTRGPVTIRTVQELVKEGMDYMTVTKQLEDLCGRVFGSREVFGLAANAIWRHDLGTALVAFDGRDIVGCVCLTLSGAGCIVYERSLYNLAVLPEFRGMDTGTALMDSALEWCRARGQKSIQMRATNLFINGVEPSVEFHRKYFLRNRINVLKEAVGEEYTYFDIEVPDAKDATIADHEIKEMTRQAHDEYQNGISEEMERIIQAFQEKYPDDGVGVYNRRGDVVHYDLRGAVDRYLRKTGNDEIELMLPNGNGQRYQVKLSIAEVTRGDNLFKVLVVIDPMFPVNHAGRNALTVYARTDIKAVHEFSELSQWLVFALDELGIDPQEIARHRLGDHIMAWVNDRSARGLARIKKKEFHNKACLDEFEQLLKALVAAGHLKSSDLPMIKDKFDDDVIRYITENELGVSVNDAPDPDVIELSQNHDILELPGGSLTEHSVMWFHYLILYHMKYTRMLCDQGYGRSSEEGDIVRMVAWDKMAMELAQDTKFNRTVIDHPDIKELEYHVYQGVSETPRFQEMTRVLEERIAKEKNQGLVVDETILRDICIKSEGENIQAFSGSPKECLSSLLTDGSLTKALSEDGLMVSEADEGHYKTLERLGIVEPVPGKPRYYRLSDMMKGSGLNEAKTFINALVNMRYRLGKGNDEPLGSSGIPEEKVLDVKELVRMTILHEIDMLNRGEHKTIWHIIDNRLLGEGQRPPRSTFMQRWDGSDMPEKIRFLKDGETLSDVIAGIRDRHPGALIDVAINDLNKISDVSDPEVKILVLQGDPGDFCQLEGIVAALRALHLEPEEALPALRRIYSVMGANPVSADLGNEEALMDLFRNDPKGFARKFVYILPRITALDDPGRLNARLKDLLCSA